MAKKNSNRPNSFTFSLTTSQADELHRICIMRGFGPYSVNYSRYAFHGNGFNLVMYNSGKLVLQGKEAADFVTFTIEPQITHQFFLSNEAVFHPEWFTPHAGLDESGKGDFFGPVVTACVIAGDDAVRTFQKEGIKDSKAISSDRMVFELEKKIRAITGIVVELMVLSMEKYNELYKRFGSNLNYLLGWMHACSLGNALRRQYVSEGLLDQFSKRPIVQEFLGKDFPSFNLTMRTKAESDPVVAAASIIARAEYVRQMEALSKKAGVTLPKGASSIVKGVGKNIFEKEGREGLAKYSKTHFKTFGEITGEATNKVEES